MPLAMKDLWSALGAGPWPWGESAVCGSFADVVVDSRLAGPGSLFVALRGERSDGHDFVGDAFGRGALAAIVERPVEGCPALLDMEELLTGEPPAAPVCLQVRSSLTALQALAGFWRRKHAACHVVGVTGSVGKTTTKELVASVLGRRFITLKSEGNYNNEIGLPLTMLRLHSDVQWAVQEMGMYDLGEIAQLARIALPEVGVVTNVGPTHLERLGTLERIAQAKAELVQALPENGLAVLNGDDRRVRAMASLTKARSVVFYGLDSANDVWADSVRSQGLEGLRLCFHHRGQTLHARLPLLGGHSVYGALAAAAVGLSEGLGWDEVIAGLRDPSTQLRLEVLRGVHGTTLLDDTYNASPASTIAALKLLAEMDGRRIAVLGDMLELGEDEAAGHRVVGRRAAEVVSMLVTVGKLARLIGEEALKVGMPADAVHLLSDNDEAVEVLTDALKEGDFVLVKGSRGMAMENIVVQLARGD